MAAQLERAQRLAAEAAIALDVARELAACNGVAEIGRVLLKTARDLTGADECTFWARENGHIRPVAGTGSLSSFETIDDARKSLLLNVLQSSNGSERHHVDRKRGTTSNGHSSRLAIPVLFRDEVSGVLELESLAAPERWADHKLLLKKVIPMVGLALKNAQVVEENARLLRLVIDERKRREAISEASADGILIIDSERRIAGVNRALEKLTGYRAEDLIGKPCTRLLDASDSTGKCLCDFACPFDGSKFLIGRPVDATVASVDGKRVWVEMTSSVIKDDDHMIRGVVHSFRDMTKHLEAERMKDEFISVASHELMTPLTAVKGFAQLAQRIVGNLEENDVLIRSLDVLNEEADKLVALVSRMVDVSRMEAKKHDMKEVDFDLVVLAQTVIDRLTTTTTNHDLRVASNGAAMVHADRDQIEQVLMHVVGNAIKYSPAGGEVEVRVDESPGFVRASVSDQGIGIPADKQGRIFDRFYQAHAGPRGHSKGMGLGLHICRQIIGWHGGQLWVRSEEGKGSVFYFTLSSAMGSQSRQLPGC